MKTPSITAIVIEDEPEIADLIRFHLEREGIATTIAHSGQRGLELVTSTVPSLVVLDLMLPDLNGLQVCQRVRANAATAQTPIIMVTAKGSESDIIAGLEAGADDYVTKPFSPKVLVARVRTTLRRLQLAATGADKADRRELIGGRLVIDTARHVVLGDGVPVDLTITEFRLLNFLAQRPGFVRTRDQIISAVHGQNTRLSTRTVDVHVTALRMKLRDLQSAIETIRGVGYRFSEVGSVEATVVDG
ncbi:MAG: response regulator transcription factor [Planctomycetota bacterium]|nr:response regulator transcription factor [Planctomycetota bacterium]